MADAKQLLELDEALHHKVVSAEEADAIVQHAYKELKANSPSMSAELCIELLVILLSNALPHQVELSHGVRDDAYTYLMIGATKGYIAAPALESASIPKVWCEALKNLKPDNVSAHVTRAAHFMRTMIHGGRAAEFVVTADVHLLMIGTMSHTLWRIRTDKWKEPRRIVKIKKNKGFGVKDAEAIDVPKPLASLCQHLVTTCNLLTAEPLATRRGRPTGACLSVWRGGAGAIPMRSIHDLSAAFPDKEELDAILEDLSLELAAFRRSRSRSRSKRRSRSRSYSRDRNDDQDLETQCTRLLEEKWQLQDRVAAADKELAELRVARGEAVTEREDAILRATEAEQQLRDARGRIRDLEALRSEMDSGRAMLAFDPIDIMS